jgi:hypothetical protein
MSIEDSSDRACKQNALNLIKLQLKTISSQTSEEISSSNDSDIDFDKKIDWSSLNTAHLKSKFLNPIIQHISNYLKKYGPDNARNILYELKNTNLIEKELLDAETLEYMHFISTNSHLIQAFNIAPTKLVQTQILSLIPKTFSSNTIRLAIPEVNRYQITIARSHADSNGPGFIFEKNPINRERLEKYSLEYFLEFIIGEDLLHDVAYGTRVLKTAVGKIVIPDVIRQTSNSNVIALYHKNCEEQNIKPLSRTTCFKILNKCTASFRKSLKGLDSMKVDGLNAFEKLEEIVDNLESLGMDKKQSIYLSNQINSGRNYLKFKFRKNLNKSSICADHCINFALSEFKNKNASKTIHPLGTECDHEHIRNCKECLNIEKLINNIECAIAYLVSDVLQKKRILYYLKKSRENIIEWKHHIIRGFNQDIIKYKQLDQIKDKPTESLLVSNQISASEKIKNIGKHD